MPVARRNVPVSEYRYSATKDGEVGSREAKVQVPLKVPEECVGREERRVRRRVQGPVREVKRVCVEVGGGLEGGERVRVEREVAGGSGHGEEDRVGEGRGPMRKAFMDCSVARAGLAVG
jgi:hypothetical protein